MENTEELIGARSRRNKKPTGSIREILITRSSAYHFKSNRND